jgi:predicted metal-binding protein
LACDPVPNLLRAAKKAAKSAGVALQVHKASCLSTCQPGLSAVVETQDGVARLGLVRTAADAARVVAAANAIVNGEAWEQGAIAVVSRLCWRELDAAE